MHDLLTDRPDNDVSVIAVWLPVLGGSRIREDVIRSAIDGPNVAHYWDDQALSGRWFAENMPWEFGGPPAWDVYYLFDGDASWQDKPDPLVSWGYTIVATLDGLEADLDAILAST